MNPGNDVPTVVLRTCAPDESVVVLHAAGPNGFFLPIVVLLDSGSDKSLLTQRTARSLGFTFDKPEGGFEAMNTVGKESIPYVPTLMHFIAGIDEPSPVCVSVVGGVAADEKRLMRDLIGRDFLRQFDVTWKRNVVELKPRVEDDP